MVHVQSSITPWLLSLLDSRPYRLAWQAPSKPFLVIPYKPPGGAHVTVITGRK